MAQKYTSEDKKNFFYRFVSALVPGGKPCIITYLTSSGCLHYALHINGIRPCMFRICDSKRNSIELTKSITLLVWEINNKISPRANMIFSFDEFIDIFKIDESKFYDTIFKHFKAKYKDHGQYIADPPVGYADLHEKRSPEFKSWAELKIWVDVNGGVV